MLNSKCGIRTSLGDPNTARIPEFREHFSLVPGLSLLTMG